MIGTGRLPLPRAAVGTRNSVPIGVASGRAYPLHESAEKVTDAMECYRYHIAAPMFADLCQKFARDSCGDNSGSD